jgi:hypothetical protein
MVQPPPRAGAEPASKEKRALLSSLSAILSDALGVRGWATRILPGGLGPAGMALTWLLPYALVAAAAIGLATGGESPAGSHARLAGLLAWAGLYFAAAIAFARSATEDALEIVGHDILPYASDPYASAVTVDLERRASSPLWRLVPWLFAAGAATVGVWATLVDVAQPPASAGGGFRLGSSSEPFSADLLLWAVLCFYLSATATRAVMTATFHRSFARELDGESGALYALNAAESPLVLGLSKLGGRILRAWAMIFLSIVAIMVLAALPAPYGLPHDSLVLFLLVPIAGFFSLGYGSLVYLQTEAVIRAALRRFTLARALPIQQRANELAQLGARLDQDGAAELERLRVLAAQIVAGGHYGNRPLTMLSIALPLIMPVLSLGVNLLSR